MNYHIANLSSIVLQCNYNFKLQIRSPLNHNKLELFGFRTSTDGETIALRRDDRTITEHPETISHE